MMKRILWLLLLVGMLTCASREARAQNPTITITSTTVDPTGKTCAARTMVLWLGPGTLFSCDNGTLQPSGGGGGAAPCGPTVGGVQLFASSSAFGCQPGFSWFKSTNPTMTGMYGLLISPQDLPEPDLSGNDGPSNSTSYVAEATSDLPSINRVMIAAANGHSSRFAYPNEAIYWSAGTVASPSNLNVDDITWNRDFLGYVGGVYQYLATEITAVRDSMGAGEIAWQIYTNSTPAIYLGVRADKNAVVVGPTIGTPYFGLTPVSAGIIEVNQGNAVANGGSYAQLNAGLFQSDTLAPSLPVLTNASKQLISGTFHGNTTRFQMSDNTGGSGDLAKFDANGNVTDGPALAGIALIANPLSQFVATTSAQLRGVISDESGSGVAIFGGSPLFEAPILRGTSSALSGALTIGTCNTTTVAVTGATTAMGVVVTPVTNPDSGSSGLTRWDGYVSSSDTVTVRECGLGIVTPNSTAYNVAVIQ